MSALISKPKWVAMASPESPRTETYRTLRINIEFSKPGGSQNQALMVTSAKPGEGKSTVAGNLAIVYAQAGKRVLLLDANLRGPALHRLFGVSNRTGLTHLLSDNGMIEHALQDLPVPNLSLLPAGVSTAYPSELLGSERMRKLLDELRGRFDVTIVDGSALLPYSDSQVLSAFCDGVIWVVRAGKVRQSEALDAATKLDNVRAKIVGTVLNRG